MAKGQSPLLGYNTNVRHKGRVFHIQTEDSGVQHPHVITHLFADGGRILKSIKTPYGELLEAPDWVPQVKKIMQDQHKAMFIALRDGQYDQLIDPNAPPAAGSSGATGAHAALSAMADAPQTGSHPAARQTPTGQPATPAPAATAQRPASAQIPAVRSPASAPPAAANPAAATPAANRTTSTNVAAAKPTSTPAASPQAAAPSTAVAAQNATSRSGRYAPVRSPDVLGSFKPKAQESASIFGDGLMSEKSLDEVILQYLAEDLDEKK